MHVVIRGWPATIFCTTETKYVEELATRGFTYTPERSTDKFRQAVDLESERRALPFAYEDDGELEVYRQVVQLIKDELMGSSSQLEAITPFGRQLSRVYPAKLPRDMRDVKYLFSVIEQEARLNVLQRPRIRFLREDPSAENGRVVVKEYFVPQEHDYDSGRELYKEILETTKSGLGTHVIEFYTRVFKECPSPRTYRTLGTNYHKTYGEYIGRTTLREKYIYPLADVGWIAEDRSTDNKTKIFIDQKEHQAPIIQVASGKATADLAKSGLPDMQEFFTETEFGEWLDELQTYCYANRLLLEIRDPWNAIVDFGSLAKLFFRNNISEGQTGTEQTHRDEGTAENPANSIPPDVEYADGLIRAGVPARSSAHAEAQPQLIKYYQQKLADAQTLGDTERADRYQSRLDELTKGGSSK